MMRDRGQEGSDGGSKKASNSCVVAESVCYLQDPAPCASDASAPMSISANVPLVPDAFSSVQTSLAYAGGGTSIC